MINFCMGFRHAWDMWSARRMQTVITRNRPSLLCKLFSRQASLLAMTNNSFAAVSTVQLMSVLIAWSAPSPWFLRVSKHQYVTRDEWFLISISISVKLANDAGSKSTTIRPSLASSISHLLTLVGSHFLRLAVTCLRKERMTTVGAAGIAGGAGSSGPGPSNCGALC